MQLCLALFLVSGVLQGGKAGILSGVVEWMQTQYACSSTCPYYVNHVCGFDPRHGYMLADNECLMIQHNLCSKENYTINTGAVCRQLLDFIHNTLPPLVILTQDYPH